MAAAEELVTPVSLAPFARLIRDTETHTPLLLLLLLPYFHLRERERET